MITRHSKMKNDHSSKFRKTGIKLKLEKAWKVKLNWKIYCEDHSSLSSTSAVQYEFHIYFLCLHCLLRAISLL